jgi:hypothetical protein
MRGEERYGCGRRESCLAHGITSGLWLVNSWSFDWFGIADSSHNGLPAGGRVGRRASGRGIMGMSEAGRRASRKGLA